MITGRIFHKLLLLSVFGCVVFVLSNTSLAQGLLVAQLEDYRIQVVRQEQLQQFGQPHPGAAIDGDGALVYARELLGLFVDGIEKPGLVSVYDGVQYFLPLVTILDAVGVTIADNNPEASTQIIRVNTPGGAANIRPQDLRIVDGQIMVAQSALQDTLLIETSYDPTSLAFHLTLPWSASNRQGGTGTSVPQPQFTPPVASIRNLRADLNYFSRGNEEGVNSDYLVAGNLFGGGWQVRALENSEGDVTPIDYFWNRSFNKSQVLVGNSDYSLHPLLPTVEQTGIQYLVSNKPLPQNNYTDLRNANGNRQMANGVRDIAGYAEPGAIAELRIDGSAVQRTRVRLDGSYDFINVELPTRGYSNVVVLILERSSGALIESQDFSRRSGIELLSSGQHTMFTSFGQQGNALDNSGRYSGTTGAAQWRWGVGEDVTVELGHLRADGTEASEIAISGAMLDSWFASLGFAEGFGRSGLQLDLQGGNDIWQFDFIAREYNYEQLQNPEAEPRQWSRFMNFRHQLTDSLSLGLVGRDASTDYEETRFLLPTLGWNNGRNLTLTAMPNIDGDYRVDSRFSPTYKDTATYTYEADRHLLDYRHRTDLGREYYASYRSDKDFGDRAEIGLVNYFDNSFLGRAQIGLVNNDGEFGYVLDWESRLLPGFNSRLRVSKGADQLDLLDEEGDLYVQWQMTLDFAVAQNRIVPADSSWGSMGSSAITGELLIGGERIKPSAGITQIELIVDGDNYTATVQGGRYYLDGLQPGLRKVSIDTRYLPIELMPGANQNFWIRLERSAATEVPLVLEVRYAIAGRVKNVNGENQVEQRLTILNEAGRQVAQVYTDLYGLYRADNLAPGNYYVTVEKDGETVAATEVQVIDEFLFGQDLIVP